MEKQKNGSWLEASQKKTIDPIEISAKVLEIRKQNKTIATINGSFDLMHAGHLYILFEAAQCADYLIVCLNSDLSVQKYKSPDRPIIPLQYRKEMMSALFFVDFITWFDETDPREILKKIRPDVHVNGIEYGANCIEKPVLEEMHCKLHLVDRIDGLATSEIIQKIRKCDSLAV